ncbi:TadE family protein [Paenibacillus zanthoxyli]|uniref:TadE family protein n=1 Tax=Paenibacillus zanthoxyli TaxID=369399 RepID=UPI000470F0E5|nr:TadE family protein [Paenibacillus zanthoxyli]
MRTKLRGEEGSFTVEAAMVLPIIMCVTMLLLFFCLYSYQKSMLLQVASSATERAAYNWDNSHKARDGSFSQGEYDSLYWRIGDDHLLGSLFGIGESGGAAAIQLPSGGMQEDNLPSAKLGKSAVRIPNNMPGEMSYSYTFTGRKVNAKLRRMLHLPVLDDILSDGAQPKVTAQSLVAEPVEFIRTVDLMRYYGAKFRGKSANNEPKQAMKQQDASAMMTKLGNR